MYKLVMHTLRTLISLPTQISLLIGKKRTAQISLPPQISLPVGKLEVNRLGFQNG